MLKKVVGVVGFVSLLAVFVVTSLSSMAEDAAERANDGDKPRQLTGVLTLDCRNGTGTITAEDGRKLVLPGACKCPGLVQLDGVKVTARYFEDQQGRMACAEVIPADAESVEEDMNGKETSEKVRMKGAEGMREASCGMIHDDNTSGSQ